MVMTDQSAEDHAPTRRPSDVVAIAIVTLIALGLWSAPIYAMLKGRSAEPPMTGMGDIGGTTVSLGTLDPKLAQVYRAAQSHGSHFKEIPCFCGCQQGRLEHRHLLDCFVLRDGGGWESHATGCAICQGEARMALRLLGVGVPVDEVRAQILEEFGMPEEMRDQQEG